MPRIRSASPAGALSSATYVQTALLPDRTYHLAATNAVMPTPPTITQGAAATVNGQVIDLKTDARIRWHGTRALSTDSSSALVRGAAQADGTTYGTGPADWESFEFEADCAAFEVYIWNGGSAKPFVIAVDGYRHTATAGSATGDYVKVDFGGRRADGSPRRIQVSMDACYFKQLRLTAIDTVFARPIRSPKLVILGDSYATGFAARAITSAYDGYGQQLARLLGCEYRSLGAMSNTGFVQPNAPYGPYQSRVNSIIADAPNVVLVQGSVNDTSASAAAVGTAAASVFAALSAGLPNAVRIATGILTARSSVVAGDAAQNAAIQAAAAANGFTYIDTAAWVTGTGRSGATNGAGNSDLYTYTDGIHPTTIGGLYFATRLAGEIRLAVPTLPT